MGAVLKVLNFDHLPNEAERPYLNVVFWCPGCKLTHPYRIVKPGRSEAEVRAIFPNGCWTWNGDLEKPTFTPSLLCNASYPQYRCHLFVTAGQIRYCDDCHHDLKGKTIDMVPIPDDEF